MEVFHVLKFPSIRSLVLGLILRFVPPTLKLVAYLLSPLVLKEWLTTS